MGVCGSIGEDESGIVRMLIGPGDHGATDGVLAWYLDQVESLNGFEPLPVPIHQRQRCHRHAQYPPCETDQLIEPFLGWGGVEQFESLDIAQPGLFQVLGQSRRVGCHRGGILSVIYRFRPVRPAGPTAPPEGPTGSLYEETISVCFACPGLPQAVIRLGERPPHKRQGLSSTTGP